MYGKKFADGWITQHEQLESIAKGYRATIAALQRAIRSYRQQANTGKTMAMSFYDLRALTLILHIQGFGMEYTKDKYLVTHLDRPLEPTHSKFLNHCRLTHWVKTGGIDYFDVRRTEPWVGLLGALFILFSMFPELLPRDIPYDTMHTRERIR